MDALVSIALPRQAYTVAVVRDILDTLLVRGGLCRGCVDDILLAVSEACANAVDHGDPAHEYTVETDLGPRWCDVRVSNVGKAAPDRSFSERFTGDRPSFPGFESISGRGILLMRYLMDEVALEIEPRTTVLLRKRRTACDRPLEEPRSTRTTKYALL